MPEAVEAALAEVGLQVPQILLPAPGVDRSAWAVVACDQYTSEPEYWEDVAARVDGKPSTLHLVYPEVYLHEGAEAAAARTRRIHATMQTYLREGVLRPGPPGLVLSERTLASGARRLGLMVGLDLDRYDYRAQSTSLVRATEGTILDRLPPRIAIREQAALELPHVLVLIDDPERTVLEPLVERAGPELYDVDLMKGGGRLRGRLVSGADALGGLARALAALGAPARMQARYGVGGERGVLLYAVGDGNHSLATAKAIWETMKERAGASGQALSAHPARHALCELTNLHDPSLEFEAIHRVLFDADLAALRAALPAYFARLGAAATLTPGSPEALAAIRPGAAAAPGAPQLIPVRTAVGWELLRIERPPHTLAVGSLQGFLDEYLRQHAGSLDYVHGEDAVVKLAQAPGRAGFFLPVIGKHELFRTVMRDGPLPRKAFSMGHAHDKRYYFEARRIRD